MDFSDVTIRVVLLLVPGFLSTIVVDQLTVHTSWSNFKYSLYALILGVASYLVLQLVYWSISAIGLADLGPVLFWSSLQDSQSELPIGEILFACLCSVFLGAVISAGAQNRWLFRIARRLKVSEKYGNDTVLSFFLTAKETTWIWVRCSDRQLTYEGLIEAIDVSTNKTEILLRDVKIFSYVESELLYEVPHVYLNLDEVDYSIERPPQEADNIAEGETDK